MSDTPRTDAEVFDASPGNAGDRPCFVVDVDFARTLERELAEAKFIGGFIQGQRDTAIAERDQLRAERDDALEQAKQARASRHAQEELTKKAFTKWQEEKVALRAELATWKEQPST